MTKMGLIVEFVTQIFLFDVVVSEMMLGYSILTMELIRLGKCITLVLLINVQHCEIRMLFSGSVSAINLFHHIRTIIEYNYRRENLLSCP